MARKEILMEELVEVLYQWHMGRSMSQIKRSVLYQTTIDKLLSKKYMVPKQAYRILRRDYEYPLSYSSFKRYINIKHPRAQRSCLRIEVGVGEEMQVDFGYAGMMYDPVEGRMRRAHIFVMTLSYSRLPYVEFVFDQGYALFSNNCMTPSTLSDILSSYEENHF